MVTQIADSISLFGESFPKIHRIRAQVFLYETGEIRQGGEVELVADFGQGEAFVAKQAADFQSSVARNPVVGGEAAYLLRHFGEVFRCDTKLVGIVADFAVRIEIAMFQKGEKTVHDLGVLRSDLVVAVKIHMEIEEVDNHTLYGINHRLTMEVVVCERQPLLDVVEVECAHLLLLGGEPHDGVVEQGQMPLHAVVALRRTHLDELLRDIDGIDFKILALHDASRHIAAGENQAVVRLEAKCLVVELKIAMPLATIGVAQVARKPLVAEVDQGVFYDNVGAGVHGGKITKKFRNPSLCPSCGIIQTIKTNPFRARNKRLNNQAVGFARLSISGIASCFQRYKAAREG